METKLMTRKDDLVVGAITNYDYKQISPWVNSLEESGFEGHKAMLIYNAKQELVEKLTAKNFSVFTFGFNDTTKEYFYKKDFSIVVERFFHLWHFLRHMKGNYRYLIATDVKDVIFQNDPSIWLENNFSPTGKKICVASESIRYKDEDWGKQNFTDSFGPIIFDQYKDNIILNAGTISGEFDTMIDLFLALTQVSISGMHTIHNPDQAALNLLLGLEPYKGITHIAPSYSGYAAQLGTTNDPNKIEKYGPLLTEYGDLVDRIIPPRINLNFIGKKGRPSAAFYGKFFGAVFPQTTVFMPHAIVHQYDRIPGLREAIYERFGDE